MRPALPRHAPCPAVPRHGYAAGRAGRRDSEWQSFPGRPTRLAPGAASKCCTAHMQNAAPVRPVGLCGRCVALRLRESGRPRKRGARPPTPRRLCRSPLRPVRLRLSVQRPPSPSSRPGALRYAPLPCLPSAPAGPHGSSPTSPAHVPRLAQAGPGAGPGPDRAVIDSRR